MERNQILAARDINSRAEHHIPVTIPSCTGNPVLDAYLYDIAHRFNGGHDPETLLQLLSTVMNAASSSLEEHDIAIMNRVVDEMLAADKMFLPYRNIRKITCFGSARIQKDDPAYRQAQDFAHRAAQQGYMVITGGGPGIMQACNEGATERCSFGLNITLPYEQHPNPVVAGSEKMMNFYYFFTRKLNFLKQTDALVAFPGGFGTMDEIFETITLIQTGKSTIFPVVLLDTPGETFWGRWVRFIEKELLDAGLISREDMRLLYVSKSAEDALAYIERFYRRYHSYYFDENFITIRMHSTLPEKSLEWISHDFANLMPKMDLVQLLRDDRDPEPQLAELPRLHFTFKRGDYALLKELLDAIND